LPISRKHFVAATALGISSVALKPTASPAAQGSPLHFHILKPGEYDYARMLRTLRVNKRNKQVFQSVSPLTVAGTASLYLHMQNSMNAFEFSYGMGRGSLATLGILTGPSVAYALADAMWAKYGFGAAFNLAATNVYYRATSLKETRSPDDPDSIYQDWSAQAVLHRGGSFMVCHNALTGVAGADRAESRHDAGGRARGLHGQRAARLPSRTGGSRRHAVSVGTWLACVPGDLARPDPRAQGFWNSARDTAV
jgi:hypothetical protein